jgi:hypothetical protein
MVKMREETLAFAEELLRETPPRQMPSRVHGLRRYAEIPLWLGVASIVFDRADFRKAACRWLDILAGFRGCGPGEDLMVSHLLIGLALGYHWAGDGLGSAARRKVKATLLHYGRMRYEECDLETAYWVSQFLQNHSHVCHVALLSAAVALERDEPEATAWLEYERRYWHRCLKAQSPDGSSPDGLRYACYGWEAQFMAMDILRQHDGKAMPTAVFAKAANYIQAHLLAPGSEQPVALHWGDSRDDKFLDHGPAALLFWMADAFRDPAAQWAGKTMAGVRSVTRSNRGWLHLLWYNPAAAGRAPGRRGNLAVFPEWGLAIGRTGWTSRDCVLGFRCGPGQPRVLMGPYTRDLGCAHTHPDALAWQLSVRGERLIGDPKEYVLPKLTSDHGTITVNGIGQLGEGHSWFQLNSQLNVAGSWKAALTQARPGPPLALAGDAAPLYPRALGVERCARRLQAGLPDWVVAVDDFKAANPVSLQWRLFSPYPFTIRKGNVFSVKGPSQEAVGYLLAPGGGRLVTQASVSHAHLGFGEPGATLTCYELRLELEAVTATRMVLALRLDGDARIPRIVSRSGGRFAVVFPGAGKAEFAAVAGSAVPRGMGWA